MKHFIILAGYGQIFLALISLALPGLMNWKGELSRISALFRQMFWTYAAYLFFINIFWGLLSVVAYDYLLDGSPVAVIITIFIALYWSGRIFIQFFYFDRKMAPEGFIYRFGEVCLVLSFLFFALVYISAALSNIRMVNL